MSAEEHSLEILGLFLNLWTFHVVVAVLLSAPILFLGRRRIHWNPWECLALVLPIVLWAALMQSPLVVGRKTLANLVEVLYLSLAVPVAALLRVMIGPRWNERAVGAGLVAALCAVAAGVFFLVPTLPE